MHADENYKTMYKDISVYFSLSQYPKKVYMCPVSPFFCSVCLIKIEGKTDRTGKDW